MAKATCLCGKVRISVSGPLSRPSACHCRQCRKQSGHFWASVDVDRDKVRMEGEEAVRWYQASSNVRRGFCGTCGSFLFWDPLQGDQIAVAMGAFEAPTGTQLSRHIFTADKGDYYDIADGLPQKAH